MLGLDPAERRDAEGLGPVLKQWVVAGGLRGEGLVLLIHEGHMGVDFLHCSVGEDRGQSTWGGNRFEFFRCETAARLAKLTASSTSSQRFRVQPAIKPLPALQSAEVARREA